jgi:hypothetical protein
MQIDYVRVTFLLVACKTLGKGLGEGSGHFESSALGLPED